MPSFRSRTARLAAQSVAALAFTAGALGTTPASATTNATGIDLCAQAARTAGFAGKALVTAIAVAMAESHCNPQASHVNRNGTVDYGLWQVNSIHPEMNDPACRFDPVCNAKAAWRISAQGMNFCPWSTYDSALCPNWVHNNAYKAFLPAAQSAAGQAAGGGSPSLGGEGRASVVSAAADGTLTAWHNAGGFATTPFDASAVIGQGFTDPARIRFADLDGKGRVDLIYVQPAANPQNDPEGTIRAWHNDGGYGTAPFGNSIVIGQGFMDPARVQFADLDGKGRADLVYDQPAANPLNDAEGTLRAWHNDGGFNPMPFGTGTVVGTGFMDPTRVRFADLDGDRKADLIYDQPAANPQNDADGTLRAWHNDGGSTANPFGTSLVIGTGFTDPTRVRFADLDGKGRADLVYDQPAANPQNDADGTLRAWHNDGGFAAAPFGTSVVIGTGFTNAAATLFA